MKKIKEILLLLLVLPFTLGAQDLHFSQFFNSPLSTNPANTGFLPASDYRVGAHYRNQWSNIMFAPYRTYSVFGDAQVFRDRIENGWLGLGALMIGDVAGAGSLRSTKVYASVAYHQMLGNSSLLSAGFNVGWANKRIDQTLLKFPDQFDGQFFDSNLPTSVAFTNTGVSYFDMQAGLNYAYFPTTDIYINAGYSVHHVNRPQETFFEGGADDSRIPMRHIGFINAMVKLNDKFIINPAVFYTTQAAASQVNGGLTAFYNLSEFGEKQLLAGVYYRHLDAVIPMLGFEINNLRFTFSYDATMSTLRNFNNMRGAGEFSLIKNGFYPTSAGRQSMCPHF
jgi:type IX secretion system PorP/SprF family membrane protein